MKVIHGGKDVGGSFQDSPDSEASEDARTFVVFSLAQETFAIGVEHVKEIIRVPQITWVPGSRDPVKGVINLRGSVVPLVDLAGVLSIEAGEETPQTRIVIVESKLGLVGMLVDGVNQVTDIAVSETQPAMKTLGEGQRDLVQAQTSLDDVLVGLLDIDRIIEETRSSSQKAL